ncbi:MAG: transposase [Gammaproteobacteria bacterium]|nr:MAG: transposase [Gammaproteobacteria bacterium]
MYVVQKNHLRLSKADFSVLFRVAHRCKNLYNTTLYTIRMHFNQTGEYISWKELYHLLKAHPNYTDLSSDHAQLTIRKVRQNFSSFFELLKKQKEGSYTEKVGVPRFLPKDGLFQIEFISRQIRREGRFLRLSLGRAKRTLGVGYIYVRVPRNIENRLITGVRIIPKFRSYFEIEFLYEPDIILPELDSSQYLGIDLGLDNFATAVSTRGTAFILEGRGIKSFNRWWNKQKGKLQSTYDKMGLKSGRKMERLQIRRYNTVRNYLSHQVNAVVRHCIEHRIGTLVIGDWGDMKRGLRMRKHVSQSFQQIPFALFRRKLQSKAELHGIEVVMQEESYTSQMCSNCGLIRKSNRVHRGLYRCSNCHMERNADVNGAINILRKVVPEEVFTGFRWNSGDIISPRRLKLVSFRL